MTEDLGQGYGARASSGDETASTVSDEVVGTQDAPELIGQAVINIGQPAAGQSVPIQAQAGQRYVIEFDPGEARIRVEGNDLILLFPGDASVTFADLGAAANQPDAPIFEIAGQPIASSAVFAQALALAEGTLETAAAPGALGTGATQYEDDLGKLIELLLAQPGQEGTELESSLLGVTVPKDIFDDENNPPVDFDIKVEAGFADVLPFEFAPGLIPEVTKTFAYSISNFNPSTEAPELFRINLDTGESVNLGPIKDDGRPQFGDFEGLTFGTGADAGFLFAYDDNFENNFPRIFKIDPTSATVVAVWEIASGQDLVTQPGFTVNSAGEFFAISDGVGFGGDPAGLYQIVLSDPNGGTFTTELVALQPEGLDFRLSGLVANPANPSSFFALGTDPETRDVKLISITLGSDPASASFQVLPGTISFEAHGEGTSQLGLSFAPDGTLWGLVEETAPDHPAYAFQIDPASGNSLDDTLIVLPPFQNGFESIAVTQEVMDGPIFPGADMPMPFIYIANKASDESREFGVSDNILKVSLDGKSVEIAVSEGEIQAAIGGPVDFEESGVQVDAAGNIFFTTDRVEDDQSEFVLVKIAETGEVRVVAQGTDSDEDLLFDAEGLALASDGTLYVLEDTGGPRVTKIENPLDTPSVSELAGRGDIVDAIRAKLVEEGIAADESDVFVENVRIDQGIAVSADGATLFLPIFEIEVSTDDNANGYPYGASFASSNGSDDIASSAVIAVDAATGTVSVLTTLNGDDSDFDELDEFIAVAPGGDILVVDDEQDTVFRVDPENGSTSVFLSREQLEAANDGHPVDLDAGFGFDANGNFYIANQSEENEESDSILMFPALDPAAGTIIPQAGMVIASHDSLNAQIGNTGINFAGDLDIGNMPMTVPTGAPSEFTAPAAAVVLDNRGGEEQILRIGVDGSVSVAVTHEEIEEALRDGIFDSIDIAFSNRGIALDPAGNIYFSLRGDGDGAILVKPADGGAVQVLASTEALREAVQDATARSSGGEFSDPSPRDITFSADGFLYVAEEDSDSILKIDPITGDVRVLTTRTQLESALQDALQGLSREDFPLSNEDFLSVDLDGGIIASADGTTLYVTSDEGPDALFAIDLATGTPSVVAADPRFADLDVYIALAPNGDIIVGDDAAHRNILTGEFEGGDTIWRITPDGEVEEFLTEAQLTAVVGEDPDLEGGFWFDSDGNFYIAEEDTSSIYRWSAADPAAGTIDPDSGIRFLSESDIAAATGNDPDFDGGAVFRPETPSGFGAGFFFEFAVGSTGITNIRGTDVEDGITTRFTITSLPTDENGDEIGFLLIDRGGDGVVDEILGTGFGGVPVEVQTGDAVIYFLPQVSFKVKPEFVMFNYFTVDSDGLDSLDDGPATVMINMPDVQPTITVQSSAVDEDDIEIGSKRSSDEGQPVAVRAVVAMPDGQQPGSDTHDLGDPPFDPLGFQPDTAIGRIRVDFGFDGPGSVRLTQANIAALEALELTSSTNDAPLDYVLSADGRTLVATAGEGEDLETVFILRIAPEGSASGDFTYTLELHGSLNHALTDDPDTLELETRFEDDIVLPLEIEATDNDGDTATASFEVTITDDVPTIGFDIDGAEGGRSEPHRTAFSIDADVPGNSDYVAYRSDDVRGSSDGGPDLWTIGLPSGSTDESEIEGVDGAEPADFEGLTFGPHGQLLFAFDAENGQIVRIDPDWQGTGHQRVTGAWRLVGDPPPDLENVGLTVNADGRFFVIDETLGLFAIRFFGEDGTVEGAKNGGTFTASFAGDTSNIDDPANPAVPDGPDGKLHIASLAADPNDPLVFYAMGDSDEGAENPVQKLIRITLEPGDTGSGLFLPPSGIEVLPGTIAFVNNDGDGQQGLHFAPDGTLWGLVERDSVEVGSNGGDRSVIFRIDPETGNSIPGTEVTLGDTSGDERFESLAVTQEDPSDLKIWEERLDHDGQVVTRGVNGNYKNGGASASAEPTVVFGADGPESDPVLSDDPTIVTPDATVTAPIKIELVQIETLDESGVGAEGGDMTISSPNGVGLASGLLSREDPSDPDSPAEEVLLGRLFNDGVADPRTIVGFLDRGDEGARDGIFDVETDLIVFVARVGLEPSYEANGQYQAPVEFELIRPLVHPDADDPTTEDNESEYGEGKGLVGSDLDAIKFTFSVTTTDDDGDTHSLPITVTVDDDGPREPELTKALVDEDGLPERTPPGGNDGKPGGPDDDPLIDPNLDGDENEATFAGVLNTDFGADGPGDIDFSALDGMLVLDRNGEQVLSRGEPLTFKWEAQTHTLTALDAPKVLFMDRGSNNILRSNIDGTEFTIAVTKEEIEDLIKVPLSFNESDLVTDPFGNIFFTIDDVDEDETLEFVLVKPSTGGPLEVVANDKDVTDVTGADRFDPEGIVRASDGTLYVLDEGDGARVIEISDPLGESPVISVLASENAIGDALKAKLLAEVPSLDPAADDIEFEIDQGIAISPDGQTVYLPVANIDFANDAIENKDGIIAIDTDSGEIRVLTSITDNRFVNIDEFITFAPNGDLIVADDGNSGAADPADRLWRVDAETGEIKEFLNNDQLEAANGGNSVDPDGGMHFDVAGNFYFAQENGSILFWPVDDRDEGTVKGDEGRPFATADAIEAATGVEPELDGGLTIDQRAVFEVRITDLAAREFKVTVFDQLDHPVPGAATPGEAIEDDIILDLDYTITDFDGDTQKGTLELTIDDDSPRVSEEQDTVRVDEDGLPARRQGVDNAGIPGGMGDKPDDNDDGDNNEATAAGRLNYDFGADGPGGVALGTGVVATDGADGSRPIEQLKSLGDLVTFSLGANPQTLIGKAGSGEGEREVIRIEITDTATGAFTVELIDQLDHPAPFGDGAVIENDIWLSIPFTVTDLDGDETTGFMTVVVNDDSPEIVGGEGMAVREADIVTGDTSSASFRFGADGPADVRPVRITLGGAFDLDETGIGPDQRIALESDGQTVQVEESADGLSLRGFITLPPNGSVTEQDIFTATLNPETGVFDFKLVGPMDHPDLHETGTDDQIRLDFNVTVMDFDGDTDTVTLSVTVDDDGPTASIARTGVMVTRDESAGLQDDDTDDPAVAQLFDGVLNPGTDPDTGDLPGFARSDAPVVTDQGTDFGADGPGTTALSLSLAPFVGELASGLSTTDGTAINLFLENGLVVGRAGDATAPAAFAIHLDADTGVLSVAQYMSLFHPLAGDAASGLHDDTVFLGADLVFVTQTVTDNDGDTVTITLDLGGPTAEDSAVKFDDDGPTRSNVRLIGLVREDGMNEAVDEPPAGPEGNDLSTGADSFNNTSDQLTAGGLGVLFSVGADGPLTTALSTDVSGLPKLLSKGVELAYAVAGDTLTATADGRTVFTLKVNPEGTFEFDLDDQLDHVAGAGENLDLRTVGGGSVGSIDFSSVILGIDSDGDTVGVGPDGFIIRVADDQPVANNDMDMVRFGQMTRGNVVSGADPDSVPNQLKADEPGADDIAAIRSIEHDGITFSLSGDNSTVTNDGGLTLGTDYFFAAGVLTIPTGQGGTLAIDLLGDIGAYTYTARDGSSGGRDTITFEGLAADGTPVSEVTSAGGRGPIRILGENPAELPGQNAARIFDSSFTTPGQDQSLDRDLGTPNADFGGPGLDVDGNPNSGGNAGSPFENDTPLGNLLIVTTDPDVPNDSAASGTKLTFDFSALGVVTMESMTIMDFEVGQEDAAVSLFDASGALIGSPFSIPIVGDNGVTELLLGSTPGVVTMEVVLNGSGAIDNIAFSQPRAEEVTETFKYTIEDGDGDTAMASLDILVKPGEVIDPGNSAGTLSVDGDLTIDGQVLKIELGGTEAGESDLVEVSGEVTLLDGLIELSLIDGYLPDDGDEIVFLTAGGGLTGDPDDLSVAFSGVTSDFAFDLDFGANAASFTALADAEAGDSTLFFGGTRGDSFAGGAGDDTLMGGLGDDLLLGGEGADTFVLNLSADEGDDTLGDFSVADGDTLAFSDVVDVADAVIESSFNKTGSSVTVDLTSGTSLTITDVSAAIDSVEDLLNQSVIV